jgi:hypothetical protein
MSLNSLPVSRRTLPTNTAITANGSYTLPQYAFVPNAGVRPIASGFVPNPSTPGISANFVLPGNIASRPYPVPVAPGSVYGVRAVVLKQSPGS